MPERQDLVQLGAPTSPRTKIVHFIRHGHSTLNGATDDLLAREGATPEQIGDLFSGKMRVDLQQKFIDLVADPVHVDSELTDKGKAEAAALRAELARSGVVDRVEVVLVSPNRRTLQTAAIALKDTCTRICNTSVARGHPIEGHIHTMVATDLWREFGGVLMVGNHRSPASHLTAGYPSVDFSRIAEVDPMREREAPRSPEIGARAWNALMLLVGRDEREMIVVTHGGVLGIGVFEHDRVEWVGPPLTVHDIHNCAVLSVEMTHTVGQRTVWLRALGPTAQPSKL
jgi:broad specificity phosphatase PhoE